MPMKTWSLSKEMTKPLTFSDAYLHDLIFTCCRNLQSKLLRQTSKGTYPKDHLESIPAIISSFSWSANKFRRVYQMCLISGDFLLSEWHLSLTLPSSAASILSFRVVLHWLFFGESMNCLPPFSLTPTAN